MSKDTVAKGTVHSSVAAETLGPPPKLTAATAVKFELAIEFLAVAKSPNSVHAEPFHDSVFADAVGSDPPNIIPFVAVPDPVYKFPLAVLMFATSVQLFPFHTSASAL